MPKLSRGELANLAIGLPIAALIIGLLAGAGVGFAGGWVLKPRGGPSDDQVSRLTLEAFSPDQIQFKCGQIKGEELASANERIAALSEERELYEQRVLELEAQLEEKRTRVKKSSGGGDASAKAAASEAAAMSAKAREFEAQARKLAQELEAARDQLATVTRQLSEAEEEKRVLQEALVRTSSQLVVVEEQLQDQKLKTKAAETDAMQQKWWRFLADAQLSICEKGNRKKLGRCRETVQELLAAPQVRNKVVHCVRSAQATPTVKQLEKEGKLPRYAMFIEEDSKITKDWYVQLCDPTLPEASGLAPMSTADPNMSAAGREIGLDLHGLEDLDE